MSNFLNKWFSSDKKPEAAGDSPPPSSPDNGDSEEVPFWAKHPLLTSWAVHQVVLGLIKGGAAFLDRIKSNTMLELDLRQVQVTHSLKTPSTDMLYPNTIALRDVIFALEEAKDDKRISGLVVYVQHVPALTLADIDELRTAIERFRESGKHTVFYAETMGSPAGSGMSAYYLASAFEHIYVSPTSLVQLIDLSAEGLCFFCSRALARSPLLLCL